MKSKKFINYFITFCLTFLTCFLNSFAASNKYDFDFTGNYEEFIASKSGYYRIELWGAQGGTFADYPNSNGTGGYGGYTAGTIFLEKGTKIYVYVGQASIPVSDYVTFNGGTGTNGGRPGGGATDIRLVPGQWNSFDSLKSRIMVAAGGGTGNTPGSGGGLVGKSGARNTPGYQTGAGAAAGSYEAGGFGYGGGGSGGGSGYYGAGGSATVEGASGGSSFISGHDGCNAITATSTENAITHTGSSTHYSNMVFTDTLMIDGDGYKWTNDYTGIYIGMPSPTNNSELINGKSGNGYARITYIVEDMLSNLQAENAEVSELEYINFEPIYTIYIPETTFNTVLSAEIDRDTYIVSGLGNVTLKAGETQTISAIDKDGNISLYKLNVVLKPLNINVSFAETSFIFNPKVYNYNLNVTYETKSLTPIITVPDGVTYEISDTSRIKTGNNKIVLTVKKGSITDTYTFNINRETKDLRVVNIPFSNDYYLYKIPHTGDYKIELWGASGTENSPGGYTSGVISLEKDEVLYFYVGQSGTGESNGLGFNAGYGTHGGPPGGGATDVRIVSGFWWEFPSLKSRIMVAAGGGTGTTPGAAGGLVGYSGAGTAGGTQTYAGSYQTPYSGNAFGIATGGCGPGNGYYPGGGAGCAYGSGGGSSYISGHKGSNTIEESQPKYVAHVHTGSENHYSGKIFKNTEMIDGLGYAWTDVKGALKQMPNPEGGYYASGVGNVGDGYARITPIIDEHSSSNSALENIITDIGELSPAFNPSTFEYSLELTENDTEIKITGIPEDLDASVFGNGTYYIKPGTTEIILNATASDGSVTTYKVNATRMAGSNAKLKGFKINGIPYENFQATEYDYEVEVPFYYPVVYVEAILGNDYQTVTGEGVKVLTNNEATSNLFVTSEDKNSTEYYTIHFTREKSTELKSITFNEIGKTLNLEIGKFEYEIELPIIYHFLNLDVTPYYEGVSIDVTGNKYIGENSKTITITSSLPDIPTSTYTINIKFTNNPGDVKYDYPYSGAPETFIAPASTYYDIELWGASGQLTAYGGYVKGKIFLNQGDTLYVYVGAKTNNVSNGYTFNGGYGSEGGPPGGGATDIRLIKGDDWWYFNSLQSRIMVAAGGGTGNYPGAAGGLNGYTGGGTRGGTQTSAGAYQYYAYRGATFGIGNGGCGPGNGYYPGGGAACVSGSGGGSSFISGHAGSNSISESANENYLLHTGSPNHYSGKIFTNTVMIDGLGYSWTTARNDLELMPKPSGGYYPSGIGNEGDGYARIKAAELTSNDNYLDTLEISDGTNSIPISFEPWIEEYTINLTSDQAKLIINATPKDFQATVEGTGDYDVPPHESTHTINVTAQDGSIRTYTLKFNREASSDPYPNTIEVNRMPLYLCKLNSNYCNYTFDKDTINYDITVPFKLTEVEVKPILKSAWQKVTYKLKNQEGNLEEVSNSNGVFELATATTIVVEIMSEDESRVSTYTYNFNKDTTGNNNLTNIIITNPDIAITDFKSTKYEYYLTIPKGYDSYDIEAIPEAPKATVSIRGNTNLQVGMNDCIITVTAENGDRKTYIIHMYKEYEEDILLNTFQVFHDTTELELTPIFNNKINDYSLKVGADVANLNIVATPHDPTATITGTGVKEIKAGVNKFEITVTAGGGTINTYNLTIYKDMSDNAYIENITVENHTLDPVFNKEITEYYIYLNSGEDKLNIDVLMEDERARYTIRGDSNLNKAINEIVITGIAEDKSYKVYKIYALKNISDNNYLASLSSSVGSLSPEFNKETLEYTIDIGEDTEKIEIFAEPEDKNAQVNGTGTYYLTEGTNEIILTVTSELGSSKEYKITVTKAANSDVTLKEILNSQNSTVTKVENDPTYDYLINVQYEIKSLDITGIPTASTSIVSGNGLYNLNTGVNDIQLEVTAASGASKIYTIRVVRDKSNNDDLFFLYVHEGGLKPRFNETVILYDVLVPNKTNNLHIEAITEDKNASYEVIGGTKVDNIYTYDISSSTILEPILIDVVVTAEDGITKKVYTLSVVRQNPTTENLALELLETDRGELTPPFNSDTLNYEIEVPNDITDITITGRAYNENATIEGLGTYDLKVGKNAIAVFVTGEDGVQKDYQIIVTRKKSPVATLSNLVVKSHTLNPTFNSETFDYTINTSKNKLDFTTIKTTDPEATYKVIGNLNFTVGTNTVIIEVTSADGSVTKNYTLTINKTGSNNNNLASLSIEGFNIVPNFHKGITFYTVDIGSNINNVLIKATPEDENATITGTGIKKVNTGENYFDIVVTSENNTTKTYTILVTKDANDNNYLANLTTDVGSLTPSFNKTVLDYEITVPYNVENIELIGEAEDENSTIIGLESHSLEVGENNFEVRILSEAGNIRIYKVKVIKEAQISAYLTDLKVDNYSFDPTFNKENFEYFLTVDNEIDTLNKLNLTYTKEDLASTVTIKSGESYICSENTTCEDLNLNVGMNEITIEVTSRDNSLTNEYVIYINRSLSTNNYLSSLLLSHGELNPEFNKEIITYNVNVTSDISEIEVFATTEDETARITTGLGKHELNPGENKILIKVRSQIGVTRTYTIIVNKEKSANNSLYNLILKDINGTEIPPAVSFNPEITEYTYNLTESNSYVIINAIKGEEKQSITGTGPKTLNPGENIFEVIVTAENGDIKTYTLKVENPLSNNNFALDISPSVGTLNPEFTKETLSYTLDLENEVNTLSFTVTLESNKATVSGNEIQGVPEGTSTRKIKVTAEDGSEKIYIITINKATSSDARLDSLTITDYPFEFDPDTFVYNLNMSAAKKKLLASEITAIPKDNEATVNLMGDLELTPGIINIYTIEVIAKDGYTTQTYTLNITTDDPEYTLVTNVYDINRNEKFDYVIGILPSTNILDFKNNFENDNTDLVIYDTKDTVITDETKLVGTGYTIKLEKNNKVYDELKVIIRGDLNSDGRVNVNDQVRLINYVGKVLKLNDYEMLASDLNFDGRVNVNDQVRIINYVGKVITTNDLNPKKTE